MTITITDIVKKSLSKYSYIDIFKDLDELKNNGGITKQNEFDKLVKYFMKKSFRYCHLYIDEHYCNYRTIFDKIFDMHPSNEIFSETQLYFMFENILINKNILTKLLERKFIFNFKIEHNYIKK